MNWLTNIRNNCRKATFLIEKKQVAGLNPIEELRMRIHLTGCSICQLYQGQSMLIAEAAGNMDQELADTGTLDKAYKNQLEQLISRHMKK